ncbi:GDP-mannose-dependent alpha-(1-6)-phosphatidylinositol monomannoside mannosyltransferase [Rubripirellula lacrimiformis]|uniref:GDP-mannose-dependent alpha-(1-6)-phosphatidylinositol monomannoside mannosyltransferase n=1 Tax=Rubripirellula lacrimiformis TaxID=1930273 RepID=A0A517N8Q3_9BACT|nr:glycosyltransferase family 4 protein [Rubripirellula lacrimiformis]QDT03520.1 GDP-mannose-dependent alpha-(1-6)-phosphatidylinositol monomannoside mannosyltransferase [Rubripirellula lacrimiformis]
MLPVVLVESYPQVIAGQQRTMMSLLEHAGDAGIAPTVMMPGGGMFAERLAADGWDTHITPYPESLGRYGGAIYRDGIGRRVGLAKDLAGYTWTLRRELKRIRPAAVFCNDMRGLLTVGVAAKSLGIPNVMWDKLDKPHGFLDWFQLPLVKRNPIISGPVASKYPAWQRRWYRDRIRLLPNGVDFQRFQSADLQEQSAAKRQSLGFGPDDVVLGIVGTVTHRKAHDVLLNAFSKLTGSAPNVHVLAIGSWDDSPQDQEFHRSLTSPAPANVHFVGQQNDIPAIMHAIDVLVIPSRFEGLGQVTLEAMACGKPVIGSRVGGIAEAVVDGETGLLFENEHAEELRDTMSRLVADPDLRRRMGDAGRERAKQHYNRDEKMRQIWDMVREVALDRDSDRG